MNLQDLLDELRENVLRDVSDAVRTDADSFLLTDKSLVRYLNEAQNRFAERTQCLRDESTPEITRIPLVEGVNRYALDPRVCEVMTARTRDRYLRLRPYSAITRSAGAFDSGAPFEVETNHGSPTYFYTDRETGFLGLYPPPNDQFVLDTLVLRVARLPLKPLTVENLKAMPEIPEQYHLSLVDWAAYRALTNNDIELESQIKADKRKARFNEAVEELNKKAKRLLMHEVQFGLNSNWGY